MSSNKINDQINNNSPYPLVEPRVQTCPYCNAHTSPRLITKTIPESKETIQEAHWICGRCNNRFQIGRIRK